MEEGEGTTKFFELAIPFVWYIVLMLSSKQEKVCKKKCFFDIPVQIGRQLNILSFLIFNISPGFNIVLFDI